MHISQLQSVIKIPSTSTTQKNTTFTSLCAKSLFVIHSNARAHSATSFSIYLLQEPEIFFQTKFPFSTYIISSMPSFSIVPAIIFGWSKLGFPFIPLHTTKCFMHFLFFSLPINLFFCGFCFVRYEQRRDIFFSIQQQTRHFRSNLISNCNLSFIIAYFKCWLNFMTIVRP